MRILAGGRVLLTGRNQGPEFDCPQGALPGQLEICLPSLMELNGDGRFRDNSTILNRALDCGP